MQTRFSRYVTLRFVSFRLVKVKCKHAHICKAKINNINNKTQHFLIWFVFYVSFLLTYTAAAVAAAALASSSSLGFLYYALAWPLFFFLFFHICARMLVCVVTLPPFWHSQQQREQYHSKRAARQLSKFENERESAPHTTPYTAHMNAERE